MMKVHLFVFLFFLTGCWANIKVSIDEKGGYTIHINGRKWLQSSRTALYVDNTWYSSNDKSLSLTKITTGRGIDPNLGHWNETCLNYDLVHNETHTKIVARIRQWHTVSAVTFHLDTGDQILTNTIPLHMDEVRTVFPSFNIEKIGDDDARSYFTFEGVMTGDGDKHAGVWNSSNKVVHSGMDGGPVVIFNQTQQGERDILVLSPFSRFMATSLTQTNQTLEYGVMGSMISITPNYNHSFIVFYSSKGINEGVREWGQIMQKAYNRTNQYRLNDLSINNLGYYTDNGAYYYYHTEDGQNYEQTMIDALQNIPLRFYYLQIDSWWYYKGIGDGVSQWVARPDIFPNGLPALHNKLNNISIVAHNRYWAYDTVYKNNYSFVLDEKNGKALPVGNDSFWIDLFTQARQWGLIVYEQDWLITQTREFTPLQTDLHLGHQWLMSMGEAANKLNINIQYCMSLPRHILTALQIPRVTQTRVSRDYANRIEGKADQWTIGISSLFADALGLAPFKDVFWSSTYEPGSPYPSYPHEDLPEREIIIAILSTGPVAPGDGLNYTSSDRIMKCCRADGLILKPDRPLTMIDRLISDWALYNSMSQGELYTTKLTIDNQTFHIIFASAMKQDYTIHPSMLGIKSGALWDRTGSHSVSIIDGSNPLHISADTCSGTDTCVWYISPLWQLNDQPNSGVALLGDFDKWTPVSPQRFTSIIIDQTKNQVEITYQGVPHEEVYIMTYQGFMGGQACFVNANGTGSFVLTTSLNTCTQID